MNPHERHQLIDDLLENQISEADFLRLEAELIEDPGARREYYDRITLSLLLESASAEAHVSDGESSKSPARSVASFGTFLKNGPTSGRSVLAVCGATVLLAVTVLIAAGVYTAGIREQLRTGSGQHISAEVAGAEMGVKMPDAEPGTGRSTQSEAGTPETTAAGFGVIRGQSGALWADSQPVADGSLIPAGELHLTGGLVKLELFSGVVLVLEGETRLTVLNPMQISLSQGKLRAWVPEPAQGFEVLTQQGQIVDLGTEFAVDVTSAGAEVHVLDGEIEWKPQGAERQRMTEGQATHTKPDGSATAIVARDDQFVGPARFEQQLREQQRRAWQRWQSQGAELLDDPALITCFRPAADQLSTRRLPNLATDTVSRGSPGAVVAAVNAANRWGQSDGAIDFSPAGSRVRMSVRGEFQSITLSCWVRINSLDRWYNSLFMTDGHEAGEPHWQLMDDGRLFFSVKMRDRPDIARGLRDQQIFYSPPFWNPALSGTWLMLTTVYDGNAAHVSHYLNGSLLSREAIAPDYLVKEVRIGPASLGNWSEPMYRSDPEFAVRNLNGSLDEFLLFSRALSANEIADLYRAGSPQGF